MFDIIIYCDGASRRNPGLGGWGAVIIQDCYSVVELGGHNSHASNNQMELVAAIEALEQLEHSSLKSILILTDSSYLIHGITNWVPKWNKNGWRTAMGTPVKNIELWQRLDIIYNKIGAKQITLRHIPAHSGFAGNERVDKIATSFADRNPVSLYKGLFSDYKVFPNQESLLPKTTHAVSLKKKNSRKNSRKKAYSYVSMVDQKIKTHLTWDQCLRRVNGVSGARFKKAFSKEDEEAIICSWKSYM